MTTAPQNQVLSHLTEKAQRAHYWTSFSPERRGEQLIKAYSEQLTEDIAELEAAGIDPETITGYKQRYESLFSSWLSAKSRCASSMIAGPANFNVRRAEKANRSEDKHYTIFQEWRTRAKRSIIRKAQPAKTFLSEIDRYKQELEAMKANHVKMKEANKTISKANKEGKDISEWLINEMGVAPHMVNWSMKFGFGLQNNNANMKRVEQRIKELEAKETMRQDQAERNYTFDGGEVVINYEADRIQIFFSPRPTPEELTAWKAKGLNSFNWSPSVKAWQRKITPNALQAVKRMLPNIAKQ